MGLPSCQPSRGHQDAGQQAAQDSGAHIALGTAQALGPSDWLTAAVAPLDMDMATTMRNRPHWLTMPSAACTSALMRPATQILMKPMKKTRYIMSICGQVSFHMARGKC